VEEFHGVMGITVKDLISGYELKINENEVFPVASSIKIPILIELFRKAKAGLVNLDEEFTIQEKNKTKGSGVLNELGNGTITLTMRDLATLMIIVSDNTATNILIDIVGMDDVNLMLGELGLKETKLQRKMQDYIAASKGRENISTPLEFMRLLEYLYDRKGLDTWVCEQTLSVLKKSKDTAITRGIPMRVEVANKPGGMLGVSCDVGIVYQPHRPYIIVIMTKEIPLSDPKKLFAMEQMVNISKIVYEYFWYVSSANPYGMIVPKEELKKK
jgi:beta-lactamase class A